MCHVVCILALINLVYGWNRQTQADAEKNVQHVDALAINSTAIAVYWDADRSSVNEHQEFEVTVTPAVQPPITTTEIDVYLENLQPSTKYEFHVYLRREDGTRKEPGVKATATTWGSVEENPTNLIAEALNSTTIRLKWEAVKRSDRTPPIYTIVVNLDKENAIRTEETTYDFAHLMPFTDHAFDLYSTKTDGSWYRPGIHKMQKTLPEVAEVRNDASVGSPNPISGSELSPPRTQ